jgi:HD-GYP domain-containing protein (c-di-GMP phosphodiesterase class II)
VPNPPKAPRSSSQALLASVRKYGRAILCNFNIAIKTSRLYSFAHVNVTESLHALEAYIQNFIRLEGKCQIARLDECLYLNEVRIKVDFGSFQSFHNMLELVKEREIGDITFTPGLALEELEALIKLFNSPLPPSESPWQSFELAREQYKIPHILISQRRQQLGAGSEMEETSRRRTMGAYFKSIEALTESTRESKAGKHANLRTLKRAIHAIVDLALSEEHTLLSLVNVKGHRNEGSNHAVNVAVLSTALGAKLGMPRKFLGELGLAALLHDMGKIDLPEGLRSTCRNQLSPEDITTYHTHVFSGAERLLKERMVDSVVKTINVVFLHHYRHDGTGYPKLMIPKQQNVFTRIVAVADFYDNATTPGRLEENAQTPEAVLRLLMARSGTEFDPLVVKAFVNLMGLYPLGCMVRLDTGEVGTVIAPASDSKFLDRPTVRIVAGTADGQDRIVNLLDRNEHGRFSRSILKLYQREEIKFELEEYLSVI